MNPRVRAWLLILLVAALCIGSVLGVVWYRARSISPAAMLKRLPAENALVLYIDFEALRKSGIMQLLEGAKTGQDPEYQNFVRKTDFNYAQDLDAAIVAFTSTGKYMLIKGRFDWKTLRTFVDGEDGHCYNSLCRLNGSTPERKISFFPVQQNLMAMAVSPDDAGALRLTTPGSGPEMEAPNAPVWISIPSEVLKAGQGFPDGSRMFTRTLEQARSVTLALTPEQGRLVVKLHVVCPNEQDAADVAAQLSKATSLVREMIAREHQTPNPNDFSGFLTSGTFRSQGRQVFGYWAVERGLVTNLLGGGQ